MIRIGLAEDHIRVRTTIRMFLRLSKNIDVVFEAVNGREAIAGVQQHRPDILVMDIRMPELDGLSATRQIFDLLLPTRVILISSYNEAAIIAAAKEIGAHGFVNKSKLMELLPGVIETVYQGGKFFPESD